MKASAVPKHYSMTADPEEMRELILGMRTYVREYTVPEMAESILDTLEEAYQGELGSPPGPPIDENGNELQSG